MEDGQIGEVADSTGGHLGTRAAARGTAARACRAAARAAGHGRVVLGCPSQRARARAGRVRAARARLRLCAARQHRAAARDPAPDARAVRRLRSRGPRGVSGPGRPSLARHRGIAYLEWVAEVLDEDRDAFERDAQQLGFPGFFIGDPGPDGKLRRSPRRPRHLVLLYVAPDSDGVIGLDVTFEPKRRELALRALSEDMLTVSPQFQLVEDPPDVRSIAVYAPLIRPRHPSRDPRGPRRGLAVLVFRIAPLVREVFGKRLEQMDVVVLDETAPGAHEVMFESRPDLNARRDDALRGRLHARLRLPHATLEDALFGAPGQRAAGPAVAGDRQLRRAAVDCRDARGGHAAAGREAARRGARGQADRAISADPQARRGRHGHRLRGRARAAATAHRREGDLAARGGPGRHRALRARGQGHQPADAPQHGRRVRLRSRAARRLLLRDGVPAGGQRRASRERDRSAACEPRGAPARARPVRRWPRRTPQGSCTATSSPPT